MRSRSCLPAVLLAASLLALPAQADDPEILLIGNSYTGGNNLAAMLASLSAAGVDHWSSVDTTAHSPGGRQLWQHLEDADGSNGDTTLRQLLVTDDAAWDHVTIQEQSQIPGFPPGQADYDASLDAAIGLDDLVEAAGADTVFFMTWGRRLGDSMNPDIYPDYPSMQALLADGYLSYAAATSTPGRPVTVAPVGYGFRTVWEDLEAAGEDPTADGTLFSDLYAGDGSHASPAGTYLAACVIFASITGRSPVGVPWGPDALDEATIELLQEVAHRTVLDHVFEDVPYAWARDLADYVPPTDVAAGAFAISGVDAVPLVRVTQAASFDAVDVGVQHDGELPGEGRLLVSEGGELTVASELRLGVSGRGELTIEGGVVEVEAIAQGAAWAILTMTGGELRASAISPGWRQDGGRYVPTGPGPTTGPWTLGPAAGVVLTISPGGGGRLTVDGDAVLQGAIQVDIEPVLLEEAGSAVLISASPLTLDDGALVEAPTGVVVEVDGDDLVASWQGEPGDDDDSAPQDDDDSGAQDDDDAKDDDDADDDDGSGPDGGGGPGCGCAGAGPAGQGPFALLLLAVATVRRRTMRRRTEALAAA